GAALSRQMRQEDVPHCFVDMDALTHTYPRADHDPFGTQIALAALTPLWSKASAAGARHLIVPRVIERRAEAEAIAQATEHGSYTLIRLCADEDTLHSRLREREPEEEHAWYLNRATQLVASHEHAALENLCLDTTDKLVSEVATEIRSYLSWDTESA
ncbi:MAG: hypothetical protein AAGA78_13670, partial [Pseudomonadota bacterium]